MGTRRIKLYSQVWQYPPDALSTMHLVSMKKINAQKIKTNLTKFWVLNVFQRNFKNWINLKNKIEFKNVPLIDVNFSWQSLFARLGIQSIAGTDLVRVKPSIININENVAKIRKLWKNWFWIFFENRVHSLWDKKTRLRWNIIK